MTGRRWRTPLLAAVVLAVGSALLASPASVAGSGGACPGATGVTVVVDYNALGGGVVVRCAPGSPSSGFDALRKAGFAIEEVRNVPGFLCRIDDRPGPDEDHCLNTPPAGAYWSYWHAARGGDWKVSPEGGKTRTPPPGSVDGWSFSNDGSPGGAAPAPGVPPPDPPAKPTPSPTARPTPSPTAGPPTAAPIRTRPPTTPSSPPPGPSPSAPASHVAGSSAPTEASAVPTASAPSTFASTPQITSSPEASVAAGAVAGSIDPSDTSSGGSPPLGTLVGAGLIVLIGATALSARSRRSARGTSDG